MKLPNHRAFRPLIVLSLLWLGGVIAFAWVFLGRHRIAAETTQDGYTWFAERFAALTGGEGPPLTCVAGPGDPWSAALILSLKNAIPIVSDGFSDKLRQVYACLFGLVGQDAPAFGLLPPTFTPIVPDSIVYLSLAQTLVSIVLILLLIKAIWRIA